MKKVKRLLSAFLAVCLLLTGIPMAALAVEPEARELSRTGLFLRRVEQNDQGQWNLVPTDDPEFFSDVIWPDSASLSLDDKWFAGAYYIDAEGTIAGPFPFDRLTITGDVELKPLKNVEDETIAGEDTNSCMLYIAPKPEANPGDTFTLTWTPAGGPIPAQTAEYAVELPEDGFYSDNARDKAHLLGGDMAYADGVDTEFYLIVDPTQASWMSNVAITENADKASLAEVSAGVYKITVPAPTQEFNVEVQWDMQDPNDENNRWHRVRSMWMHPGPYTGLVLRYLEWDPDFVLKDAQDQPVLDEEGNPVTGAWIMPEIDPNNPMDRIAMPPEVCFSERLYVSVHYFDGETLSGPINVGKLTFSNNLAHPSPSQLGERVYGEHSANYLALFPAPGAEPGTDFTISWAMPQSSETYTCEGTIRMPTLGFYTSQTPSFENLIDTVEGGFEYSTENNTFYFAARPNFLQDGNITRTISNVQLELGARRADITKVNEVNEAGWEVWKIALKEPPFEPFDYKIMVKFDVTVTRDEDQEVIDEYVDTREIFCFPQQVAGEEIGRIELGGTSYTVRRTEAGEYIYSTSVEGSPFETETELPQGVTFDPDTYTLTLNNATLNGKFFFPARSFTHGQTPNPKPTLVINVEGTNTITCTNSAGLEVWYANLIIRGPGTLNINTMANAVKPNASELPETFGIRVAGWEVQDYTADFTIAGNVTVNINTDVAANLRGSEHFGPGISGMFDEGAINLTVSDNAKLNVNANGTDAGIRGISKLTVQGKAQVTADIIQTDWLVVTGDSASSYGSVILNGSKTRFEEWLPTLDGKRIDITGYGQITVNEEADDRGFSPSVNLSQDILDTVADGGLHLGGNSKLTINNAHLLIVNSVLDIAQTATLDMNNGFGIGLKMESSSTATINGTVTIDNIDNEYDNFCVWLLKGSTMTLNSSSTLTTSAVMSPAHSNLNNCGFMNEGTLTVNGGTHSFTAAGGTGYGFVSQRNGVTNVESGTITAEGSARALFTNSTLEHNYFTLADGMHIISQDAEDSGTELGFVNGILEGSSPTEYEFYLYHNNSAAKGFVKKAKISAAEGTLISAEYTDISIYTHSSPTAGGKANFTVYIGTPTLSESFVSIVLPNELRMAANSITLDGEPVGGSSIQNMRITGGSPILRFSVTTTVPGKFDVTAKIVRTTQAGSEQDDEDTCELSVRSLDISATSVVKRLDEAVNVVGSTAPNATVTLKLHGQGGTYPDGTIPASWTGSFQSTMTLASAGLAEGTPGQAMFDVYLAPEGGGNPVFQNKTFTVQYDPEMPEIDPEDYEGTLLSPIHDSDGNPIISRTPIPIGGGSKRPTYPFWPTPPVDTDDISIEVTRKSDDPSDPKPDKIVAHIKTPDPDDPPIDIDLVPDPKDKNKWVPKDPPKMPKYPDGDRKPIISISFTFYFGPFPYEPPVTYLNPYADPSGNVYEGIEECPLEGVTAKLYYLENEPSDKNAATGGELFEGLDEGNPLITDAAGGFAWMVPEGWWQVRFTKEGYEEAHTQWMEVLPERLGLKIFMTASDPAQLVETIERSADGKSFTVTFSKPVKNETVTADTLAVTAQGEAVEGAFYPINGDGATATKFTFVPSDGKLSPYAISIQAKAGIETYNGGAVAVMAEPYKESGKADGPTTPAGPSGPSGDPSEEEPVKNPDGSTTVTETAEDGTVTATTTWPDGKKMVETTSPAGDKAIAVTNGKGEKLADISIPATIPDTGKKYEDVHTGDWFEKNVYKTTNLGLFTGTSETRFSPHTNLTRGMLVAVLYRLSNKPSFGTGKNIFPDITGKEWYADAANWANAMGVAAGTGNGFEPQADITRQDMIALLYRYAKAIGLNPTESASLTKFTDGDRTSAYAQPAMQWAVSVGIISGKGNGTLDPKGNATRAEVATVLTKFVEYLQK